MLGRNMHRLPRTLLAGIGISVLLCACGGGGGGSSASTPIDPVDPNPPPSLFTVSGTITTSNSQAVDSDTNDPAALAISNNDPGNAQSISGPITLGGYVNQPGAGAPGRSQQSGDIDDFFRVDLLAGQRITMLVGDFAEADADLYLFDAGGEIVDFSVATGRVESVLVPANGTYLVNAYAFSGATNYILAIGTPNTTGQFDTQHYSIVPWQAVVTYNDDKRAAGKPSPGEEVARAMGMEQRAGGPGRSRLLAMTRGQHTAQQPGVAGVKATAIGDPDVRARWETLMAIKSLRRDPRIRHAEPNYRVNALATPNDQAYPLQWHYPLIGLPEAWDTTTGDPLVVVAVIDSGVLANHPDLAGQLVEGYDFISDPQNAADGDGIDPDPQDTAVGGGDAASSFHGTHVSGTVAARGGNLMGVAGSAYSSRVMPLRALGQDGGGTSYDVDQAVRYAAGLANDSGTVPDRPAQIINLSLGGAPFSQATQALFDEVRAAGVLVVAAAGNQASTAPVYPAAYNGVISVSAVDAQRRLAPYSSTGPTIDVAAPGGNNSVDLNGDGYPDGVLSTGGTVGNNGINFTYTFANGTSMASPHVAGVLALMKSVNAQLTPADIDAMLAVGELSDDLGAPGRDDRFGHGIINAQRAVLAALQAGGTTPADNPRLVTSANALNFGRDTTSLSLILRNGGKGELALTNLSASQPWLQVAPVAVDAAGLGEYAVSVDRSGFTPGIYTADIIAESSVNALAVQVLVSVGDGSAGVGAGVIYVLLYDPVLDETVGEFATGGNGTSYPFRFTDIPAGRYELLAGTDADNDLLICDAGEACGAWLTIDQPLSIELEGNRSDLDFPVEYLVNLPSASGTGATGGALGRATDTAKRRIGASQAAATGSPRSVSD
jgi:serine protease